MSDFLDWHAGQHIHLIGIGGAGLSAIARVLHHQGYVVSGSDRAQNALTQALADDGMTVYHGHDAAYIAGADAIIATSAAPDDHIEIQAARANDIPVYRRSDVMATIMQAYTVVAIAGTHGKTTTSAMTAHLLTACDLDPTYIVGGVLENTGTNAAVGEGDAFVIEADEYGDMFLGLRPNIAVLTSVEYDHPDYFPSEVALREAFAAFVARLPADGLLIACADNPTALTFAHARREAGLPTLTYGIENAAADWQAVNLQYTDEQLAFTVQHNGDSIASATLTVPGRHNVQNALAALIIAQQQGADLHAAIDALATFAGTGRRFDLRADVNGVAVIDDYAHHPTAIKTTIDAARQRYPQREIWAVWQPHTFSRTRHLWTDFLAAFDEAQHVIVTDIYAAREADDPATNSADFVAQLAHPSKFHAPTLDDAVALLVSYVQAPSVILIMSAGDAPQIGMEYVKAQNSTL